MEIHTEITPIVTRQTYEAKQAINGVEFAPLSVRQDDGGYFVELARLESGKLAGFSQPTEIKQVSLSQIIPGAIKAYHLHQKQTDVWFVSPEFSLVVNLHDVRSDSSTYGVHMRFVLGGANSRLLLIPPGVAHGVANLTQSPATLIYYTSEQFSASDPDEYRLPWNQFGTEVWEVTKG